MKRNIAILSVALAISAIGFAASVPQSTEQLSKKQLNALIAGAKTPAQHERIAAYYRAQAESLLAESNEHAKMAIELAANPATNNSKNAHGTVHHCEYIAQTLKAKSVKSAQLAEQHEQMAKDAAQR